MCAFATLDKVDVFKKLSQSDREQLIRLAAKRSINRGDILCHQGDHWPYVVFIASGELRSFIYSLEGRMLSVSTWDEGDVFWGHTVFDDGPIPATLEASKKTLIYQWQGDELLAILFRNQDAIRELLQMLTNLIRKRRAVIYDLAFNPVANRLGKVLLERFSSEESELVERDLTLEEMASMIATSPEVVCRILYQFQSDGLLEITRANITLKNRDALEGLVGYENA
jgi:CRP/FNR family transcriptional regulator